MAKTGIAVPEITEEKEYPLLKLHGSLNWYYDITYWNRTKSGRAWKEVLSLYLVPLVITFTAERIYKRRGARDYAPSTYYHMKPGTQLNHGTAELKLAIVPPVYQKSSRPLSKGCGKRRRRRSVRPNALSLLAIHSLKLIFALTGCFENRTRPARTVAACDRCRGQSSESLRSSSRSTMNRQSVAGTTCGIVMTLAG